MTGIVWGWLSLVGCRSEPNSGDAPPTGATGPLRETPHSVVDSLAAEEPKRGLVPAPQLAGAQKQGPSMNIAEWPSTEGISMTTTLAERGINWCLRNESDQDWVASIHPRTGARMIAVQAYVRRSQDGVLIFSSASRKLRTNIDPDRGAADGTTVGRALLQDTSICDVQVVPPLGALDHSPWIAAAPGWLSQVSSGRAGSASPSRTEVRVAVEVGLVLQSQVAGDSTLPDGSVIMDRHYGPLQVLVRSAPTIAHFERSGDRYIWSQQGGREGSER